MASKIDSLISAYESVIREPWSGTLSTPERVMFLVYDPAEQRKIMFRLDEFESVTKNAEKKWSLISMKSCFPTWMAGHEYHQEYFADPDALIDQLEGDFKACAIKYLNDAIVVSGADENTLVAVTDVSSLFGFVRLSDVLNAADTKFRGRLLVFFPGEFEKNHFRLMDARDGWSYLARPITT